MKKGGTKKKQTKKPEKVSRISKDWQYLILALAVLVAGMMIYQKVVLPQQEKKMFAEAEREVNFLREEINNKYPATTLTDKKSCNSPNLKFREVNPLCIFSSTLEYKNIDIEQANNLAKAVDAHLITEGEAPKDQKESPTDFRLFEDKPFNYKTILTPPNKELSCLTTYSYQNKLATLKIYISCSGEANYRS